jgi:hypothetical protein
VPAKLQNEAVVPHLIEGLRNVQKKHRRVMAALITLGYEFRKPQGLQTSGETFTESHLFRAKGVVCP